MAMAHWFICKELGKLGNKSMAELALQVLGGGVTLSWCTYAPQRKPHLINLFFFLAPFHFDDRRLCLIYLSVDHPKRLDQPQQHRSGKALATAPLSDLIRNAATTPSAHFDALQMPHTWCSVLLQQLKCLVAAHTHTQKPYPFIIIVREWRHHSFRSLKNKCTIIFLDNVG